MQRFCKLICLKCLFLTAIPAYGAPTTPASPVPQPPSAKTEPKYEKLSDYDHVFKLVKRLKAIPESKLDLARAQLEMERKSGRRSTSTLISRKLPTSLTRSGNSLQERKIPTKGSATSTPTSINTLALATNTRIRIGNNYKTRSLTGLLDTRKGNCFNLPLLYMAVARRLGYPIKPVSAPRHLFLRYVDPKLKRQNIEATGNGGFSPDAEYIADLKISKIALKNGLFLKSLSKKEF